MNDLDCMYVVVKSVKKADFAASFHSAQFAAKC